MKTLLFTLRSLMAVGLATTTGPRLGAAPEARDPVVLTVDAAAEPAPALKYTFTYEIIDQVPGNAALAYDRVTRNLGSNKEWSDQRDEVDEWLKKPLGEFPTEAAQALVTRLGNDLDQLVKATRFEDCDWGTPIRTEGINTLLPHLAEMKSAARLLGLQIRLQVRQGRYDEAVVGLRAGMTLARQTASGDLLIEGLVGIAVANMMLDRVEELVSQPGAPNLYWALSDLPPGYLNAWQSTRWERSLLYVHLPVLWEARSRTVASGEVVRSIQQFFNLTGNDQPLPWLTAEEQSQAFWAGLALAVYPGACRQLIAQGTAPEVVREMSAAQVITTYLGDSFAVQRDNLFKWFALPYPQARAGLQRTESDLAAARAADPIGSMLQGMLLPALGRAADRFAELDRRFAMLRCVEAIRDHLATHQDQLPRTLAEIEGMPAPPDPVTGQPFTYRVDGPTAVLEAAAGPAESRIAARSYTITPRP